MADERLTRKQHERPDPRVTKAGATDTAVDRGLASASLPDLSPEFHFGRADGGARTRWALGLQRSLGNSAVQRKVADSGPRAIDVKARIAQLHPYLARVLTEQQVKHIQRILDARARAEGGAATEEDHSYLHPQSSVMEVDSMLLLDGEDILGDVNSVLTDVTTARAKMYKEFLNKPVKLTLGKGLHPATVFDFRWGTYPDLLPTDGGRIGFKHLIAYDQQAFVDVWAAGLKQEKEALAAAADNIRGRGPAQLDLTGKQLGTKRGWLFDAVKIGTEVGQGWLDEGNGRNEALKELHGITGAGVMLKEANGWIHVFQIQDSMSLFSDRHLTTVEGDDTHDYVLKQGRDQLVALYDVLEFKTSDAVVLEETEVGWRCNRSKDKLTTGDEVLMAGIVGDFLEDPSAEQTVTQIVVGLIPIVGQIADARDVVAGLIKIVETKGSDGKLQTLLAIVGLVPGPGDMIKSAFKSGGRKAVAKALRESSAGITEKVGKKIIENAPAAARKLGVVMQQSPALVKAMEKALASGNADEFAAQLADLLAKGTKADELVQMAGGNWGSLTKALKAGGPKGAEVGETLGKWRGELLERARARIVENIKGAKRDPKLLQDSRPGTQGWTSDVDINFGGVDASFHALLAKKAIEAELGIPWEKARDFLDVGVFTDASRMHKVFEVGGKAGAEAVRRATKETNLNIAAKILRENPGSDAAKDMAKALGISMDAVEKQAKQLDELAKNPAAQLKLSLQMDELHARFDAAATVAERAEIAEKMLVIQSTLNSVVTDAYSTAGSVLANVGKLGDPKLIKNLPRRELFDAVVGESQTLMHALSDLAHGLTPAHAKALHKYSSRLLLAAQSLGVKEAASDAFRVFDTISAIGKNDRVWPRIIQDHGDALQRGAQAMLEQLDDILAGGRAKVARTAGERVDDLLAALLRDRTVLENLLRSLLTATRHEATMGPASPRPAP